MPLKNDLALEELLASERFSGEAQLGWELVRDASRYRLPNATLQLASLATMNARKPPEGTS